jgi:tetratricopeptide (TPR) repeat protein
MRRAWLIVFTVLLHAPAPAAAPRELPGAGPSAAAQSVQERLKPIATALLNGTARFDETARQLKEILAADPSSAEAHMLLGVAYRGMATPEMMGEAVAEFRQSLSLNPKLVPARLYLAHCYLDLGRPVRAKEELEAALAQVPAQPQIQALLGETERQLKNPKRAIELLQETLKADDSPQTRYYLSLAMFDADRPMEALAELQQVVAAKPQVVEPYLSLGVVYLEGGKVDEAIDTLNQGTKLDPGKPELRIQLARAYRSKGQLTRADEELKIAIARQPHAAAASFAQQEQLRFDLLVEQGLLRQQQKRFDAAADAFRKALEVDPNHEPTKKRLADVERQMKTQAKPKASSPPVKKQP